MTTTNRCRGALVGVLLWVFLATWLSAQVPTQAAKVATVQVFNEAATSRRAIVTVGVPFAQGVYRGAPLQLSAGDAVQVQQMGPSWPDGSWRSARVSFPLALAPAQLTPVELFTGTPARSGFVLTEAAAKMLPLTVGVRVNGKAAVFPQPWEVLEAGDVVLAVRSRLRVTGTTAWAELVAEFGSGSDTVRFWVTVGDSDMSEPNVVHQWSDVDLLTANNTWPVIRMGQQFTVKQTKTASGATVTLASASTWGDGGALVVQGELYGTASSAASVAAAAKPVLACCDWTKSGAWGPFSSTGEVPLGWTHADALARAGKQYAALLPAQPWQVSPMGLALTPGQTGAQFEFGLSKLLEAANGFPPILGPAWGGVSREACRPTHIRDAAAAPVRFSTLLPGLHMWTGQVFHRTTLNKLGKATQPGDNHGWFPRDREHWQVLSLPAYALLTGDRWAIEECNHQAELLLACCPGTAVPVANVTIQGKGPSRDLARTLLSMEWLWCATGRADLLQRERERVDIAWQQWAGGARYAAVKPVEGPVLNPTSGELLDGGGRRVAVVGADGYIRPVPAEGEPAGVEPAPAPIPPKTAPEPFPFKGSDVSLSFQGPDGRHPFPGWPQPNGQPPLFSTPWMDALAVAPLEGVYRLTGYARARELAWAIGGNLAWQGSWKSANAGGQVIIGNAVVWLGSGLPLSPAQRATGREEPVPVFTWNVWCWSAFRTLELLAPVMTRASDPTIPLVSAYITQESGKLSQPWKADPEAAWNLREWRAIR